MPVSDLKRLGTATVFVCVALDEPELFEAGERARREPAKTPRRDVREPWETGWNLPVASEPCHPCPEADETSELGVGESGDRGALELFKTDADNSTTPCVSDRRRNVLPSSRTRARRNGASHRLTFPRVVFSRPLARSTLTRLATRPRLGSAPAVEPSRAARSRRTSSREPEGVPPELLGYRRRDRTTGTRSARSRSSSERASRDRA